MKISLEDVVRVAELAHLELLPGETETYREQLDEILTYIDKLKELDVTDVEPMTQALSATPAADGSEESAHPELREDVLRPSNVAESVLFYAPDAAKPFFRVPKVIER
ncbi:MAG: Asp-tRNA(Asn)/Glu-tRNA(Gln) amidotransferase subunit GatC [Candidatus Acidiferrales bacterium]